MQKKFIFRKTAAAVLSAALVCLFGTAEYCSGKLPETVTVDRITLDRQYEEVKFAGLPELSCTISSSSPHRAVVSLFGAIPAGSIAVREEELPEVVPGGTPFGMKLLMDGVMVTGLGEVSACGGGICPAADAGIAEGDVIRTAGGLPVSSNRELQEIISRSEGEAITLTVSRNGITHETLLHPARADCDGVWRGGMWVRDSIAGIGTMTFIVPETGKFAGLGHPVCDADTGELVPLQSGEAVPVELSPVKRGERGIPGELRGKLSRTGSYGLLFRNSRSGIYGTLTSQAARELSRGREKISVAHRQQVHEGEAYILTSAEKGAPAQYTAEVEKVDYTSPSGNRADGKDMVIRITDRALLDASGGIVQGMSGSPVIQDGCLIGAVTHVFVADPSRGYAIFAETMLEAAGDV